MEVRSSMEVCFSTFILEEEFTPLQFLGDPEGQAGVPCSRRFLLSHRMGILGTQDGKEIFEDFQGDILHNSLLHLLTFFIAGRKLFLSYSFPIPDAKLVLLPSNVIFVTFKSWLIGLVGQNLTHFLKMIVLKI